MIFCKKLSSLSILMLLVTIQAACVSNPATNKKIDTNASDAKRIQPPNITIKQGNLSTAKTKGYYVIYQIKDQVPTLVEISPEPPTIRDYKNSEVIFFSNDLSFAQPNFRTFKFDEKSGNFFCFKGALRSDRDNATTDYNPCDSSLTRVASYNVGTHAFLAVASFGLSAVTGTTVTNVTVDEERFLSLITRTKSMALVAERRQKDDHERYLKDFSSATTIQLLNSFIREYASNDPQQKVPIAREKINQLVAEQHLQREIRSKQQQAMRDRELAEQEARQLEEARNRSLRQAVNTKFRNEVKIGDYTNCGPIIESKGNLLKVYFPVANYGNEHWIEISNAFPPHYPCQFVNGQYRSPSV